MRDSYRQRVYDAERKVFDNRPTVKWTTVSEIQAYTDKLIGSAWWQRRWSGKAWYVEIRPGKGHRRAVSYGGYIQLPKWARKEWVLLHELAHEVTRWQGSPHGWQFLQCYIALVEHKMGKEAAVALKDELSAKRVPWRKPKGKLSPMVNQQLAAATRNRRTRNG